jgi:hypothetical protein
MMTRAFAVRLLLLSLVGSATVFALSAPGNSPEPVYEAQGPATARGEHDDFGKNDSDGGVRLPSGQYVTPTAMNDSVHQYLNPQLPDYPDFIAGMAVRSQLSPDGATLESRTGKVTQRSAA